MYLASLKVTQLRIDGGTQLREHTDQATVDRYAEIMTAYAAQRKTDLTFKRDFPPLRAFKESPALYWLSRGFHRLAARIQNRETYVDVEVYTGTLRDAILDAAKSNQEHGLPLGPEDRRKLILALVSDPEWTRWPNTQIAAFTGEKLWLIQDVRRAFSASCGSQQDARVIDVTRGGKSYPMRVPLQQLPTAEQNQRILAASAAALQVDALADAGDALAAAYESLETARAVGCPGIDAILRLVERAQERTVGVGRLLAGG